MRLEAGTIYFARENSLDGTGLTDLVKIGLVENPRTDRERLADHQTGNPRKLELIEGQSVKTHAVKYVESQMHRAFASKRIQGEWFRFGSEAEILEAIQKAQGFAADVEERISVFENAKKLEKVFHSGDPKPSTPEIQALLIQILVDKRILEGYDTLTTKIKSAMKEAVAEQEEGREKFAHVTVIYSEPKFSVTEFKKKFGKSHADLIASCYYKEEKEYEEFNLIEDEVEVKIPEDVTTHLNELTKKVDTAVSARSYYELNELLLQIREECAPYNWEIDFNEAQIKVECGVAPGIEGVCTWIRELRLSNAKFNKGLLAELEPELYHQGFVQSPPVTRTTYKWYQAAE